MLSKLKKYKQRLVDFFMFRHTGYELKYHTLYLKYLDLLLEHKELTNKWNELVSLINSKGGQDFLNGRKPSMSTQSQSQFTQEDIKKLINLCHPDKHGGKNMASEMTAKLIKCPVDKCLNYMNRKENIMRY